MFSSPHAPLTASLAATLLALAALAALAPTPAHAAVPTATSLQGAMTSAAGGPAADGSYSLTFRLYAGQGAKSPAWTEGPVKVTVTGGRFVYLLGTSKPLDAKALAALPEAWLGVQVGSDPELPRQRLAASPYALVAAQAQSLGCTGCLSASHIAAGGVSAAKVGFNYAGSTTKGGAAKDLACTACVSAKEMKFDGDVDLSGNSLKAKNGTFTGDVAAGTVTATSFVGDGSKLTGVKLGVGSCKAGLVVQGVNADGTLKCVASSAALPKDGLAQVSNGLISNQFIDTIVTAQKNVPIPDNQGTEAVSNLTFPDLGVAQTFELSVHVENTNLGAVAVTVLPPDDKKQGWVLCDPCGAKDAKILKKTWTPKAPPKSGDLAAWVGKNPKGLWNLKVKDTSFCVVQAPGNAKYCNPTKKTDGSVVTWSVKTQTLSSKKIQVAGDQLNSGSLTVAKGATVAGNVVANGLVTSKASPLNSNFKYVLINKDWRNNSGSGWRNIPNRTLSYTKLRDDSIIRVTYQDTLGTLGNNYDRCRWRILIDGKQVAYFSDADLSGLNNYWRMSNATHTGLGLGFKKGKHTVQVQSFRNGAQECLMGWNTNGNFLAAEEVGP